MFNTAKTIREFLILGLKKTFIWGSQYASLPLGQIVPRRADQGAHIASESLFYRVLHEADK